MIPLLGGEGKKEGESASPSSFFPLHRINGYIRSILWLTHDQTKDRSRKLDGEGREKAGKIVSPEMATNNPMDLSHPIMLRGCSISAGIAVA